MSKVKMVLYYSGDFMFSKEISSEFIRTFSSQVEFYEMTDEDDIEAVKDADIFVGWPSDDMIRKMERLKWLQLPSAGANHFFDHPLVNSDVIVTNSSGVFGVSGAEHALALMLALSRQLHIHRDQQKKRIWKRNPDPIGIQDSTVAIIGLGNIGSETAKRVKALGAKVLGVKRNATLKPPYVDELYGVDQVEDVITKSDFIVNALPLTSETKHFFTKEMIAKSKKGAFFINVGRGETVDEEALINHLKSGHLGGAGLDVTSVEPLPEDNELWDMPNVFITSHSVGVAPRKQENRVRLYQQNLTLFLNDDQLINVVDRKIGY